MNKFATELTNVMMPDYINKLGMSKAPFSGIYDFDGFYTNDNKINVQKKIAHLLEYTTLTLFIQGAAGVGKTTLIKQRIQTAKAEWSVCYLSAKDYTSTDLLIEKLSTDLNLDAELNLDQNLQAISLQEKLKAFNQTGKLPILIIDDIEQLKEKLIPILSSLISPLDDEPPKLRLIISGNDIPETLLNIIPKENNEVNLKYLPVLPLTETETGEYIKCKLKVTGYEKTAPFTPKAINRIYLDAKGFPNIIDQLANHFLSQYAQGRLSKPSLINLKDNNNGFKLAAIALSLIALGIIVSIMFVSTPNKNENQQIEILPIPPNAVTSAAPNSMPDTTLIAPTSPVQESMTEPNLLPAKNKKEINQKIADDKIENSVSSAFQTTEQTSTTNKAAEQNKAKLTKASTESWINKQDPKHFTLQLIGGSQIKSTESFIKKHGIERNTYIFSTTRKGKPWFSVIYNSYPTRSQAQTAIASLPKSLIKIKPWIRSFEHIQRNMK